jgi:hypothetical protein
VNEPVNPIEILIRKKNACTDAAESMGANTFFKKRGCPGWGANPGPLDFIYFLIFTTLPLSHSGSPWGQIPCKKPPGVNHTTSKFTTVGWSVFS